MTADRAAYAWVGRARSLGRRPAESCPLAARDVVRPKRANRLCWKHEVGRLAPAAFSMIELVLALAVIVGIAALAWPSLDGMFANYRLSQAAETIRVRWATARIRAVEDGRAYQFTWSPESGDYRLSPAEGMPTAAGASERTGTGVPESNAGEAQIEEALPEGLRLSPAPETQNPTGVAATGPSGIASGPFAANKANESTTTGTIFFYPDGTTSDAELIITDARGWSIDLSLRGLTGVASVSDIRTEEQQ